MKMILIIYRQFNVSSWGSGFLSLQFAVFLQYLITDVKFSPTPFICYVSTVILIITYLTMLPIHQTICHHIKEWLVNEELEHMWKCSWPIWDIILAYTHMNCGKQWVPQPGYPIIQINFRPWISWMQGRRTK